MIGQSSQKSSSLQALTPRDDKKKVVSEILKRVDQLIKKSDLEKALAEIHNAKEIDPRNVYTLALEERITTIKAEALINQKQEKPIQIPKVEQSITVPKVEPLVIPKPPVQTEIPKPVVTEPQYGKVQATLEEIEAYRNLLMQAWEHGLLKPEANTQLCELRKIYNISDDEHSKLEKEIKSSCYTTQPVNVWSKAAKAELSTNVVTEFQQKYQPKQEEHVKPQVQTASKTADWKPKDKILVIDDDPQLLDLLETSLRESGLEVTALTTSDEAYALLRKFVPDLILCDINLETSTMGGFTFFEKVQELKKTQDIPFIFLTGLTDEALVRTGKELGVDDYLMKPISEETLLSTLRGKLKRFKQLRNVISSTSSSVLSL